MSALVTSVVPLGGDDEATDPVPDRGTPGDRGGNRGSTQGGRERGTASHEGRVVEARYGHANPPPAQDVIGGRLVQIGLHALERSRSLAPRRALPSLARSSRPWPHAGVALLR